MKVALVCDWFHPRVGGIELHLQDLAARLTAAGHEPVVITPTPGAAVVQGIRVIRIGGRRAPYFNFLIAPSGIEAIGRALADEQVDVAHCHVSIVSPAALGGAAEAQRRRIPTVLTFHSIVPQTALLARAASAAMGTRRWSACFSAVSERVASEVRPIAAGQPMRILANGIDVDFWRAPARGGTSTTVELISVMRLNAKKRPFAFIDLMMHVERRLPGRRVRLRIVGDGPLRGRLERAIARRGLSDRIELLGHRTRADVRDLLSASDVFVLPAVREAFGIAALEARCAGLPVVGMQASGLSGFLSHGRDGLLAGSDTELADHVVSLLSDEELRRRIATHNRDSTPPFDWSCVLDAHLAIYRDAVARFANV